MFGAAGHPSTSPTTVRVRRVLGIAAAVVVGAIIVASLVDQVVNSFGPADHRAAGSWAAAVSPIIEQSNSLGALLTSAPSSLLAGNREGLDGTLDALSGAAADDQSTAAAVALAPPSARVAALLHATLASRTEAIGRFAEAVGLATGSTHDVSGAAKRFVSVGDAVHHGDEQYRELLALLRPPSLLPASTWSRSPSPFALGAATHLAERLAATASLAEIRRLAIVAISLTPSPDRIVGLPTTTTTIAVTSTTTRGTTTSTSSPAGSSGTSTSSTSSSLPTTTTRPIVTTTTLQVPPSSSRSYLLPTSSISVTVVAKNAGDVDVRGVQVRVTLDPNGTKSGDPVKTGHATAVVGALGAGGSVSVVLGPLSVSSRVPTYELHVSVSANAVDSATGTIELVTSA